MSRENRTELKQSFEKIIGASYMKYKGCLIEQTVKGFLALGKHYVTVKEAKEGIDRSFSNIKVYQRR